MLVIPYLEIDCYPSTLEGAVKHMDASALSVMQIGYDVEVNELLRAIGSAKLILANLQS